MTAITTPLTDLLNKVKKEVPIKEKAAGKTGRKLITIDNASRLPG
jgi:hypothetical protein